MTFKKPSLDVDILQRKLHAHMQSINRATRQIKVAEKFRLQRKIRGLEKMIEKKPEKASKSAELITESQQQLQDLDSLDLTQIAQEAFVTKIEKSSYFSANEMLIAAIKAEKIQYPIDIQRKKGVGRSKAEMAVRSGKELAETVGEVLDRVRTLLEEKPNMDDDSEDTESEEAESEDSDNRQEKVLLRKKISPSQDEPSTSDSGSDGNAESADSPAEGEISVLEDDMTAKFRAALQASAKSFDFGASGEEDGDDSSEGELQDGYTTGEPSDESAGEENNASSSGESDVKEKPNKPKSADAKIKAESSKASQPKHKRPDTLEAALAALKAAEAKIAELSQKSKTSSQKQSKTKAPTLKSHKTPTDSMFITSIGSGYMPATGSDSEPEFSDTEGVREERKNRRGSQARRQIWSRKYGKDANHIKKAKEEERARPKEGPNAIPISNKRSRGEDTPVESSAIKKFKSKPPSITHASNSQTFKRPPVKSKPSVAPEANLHPSWEAKRKAQESLAALSGVKGTKIVFD